MSQCNATKQPNANPYNRCPKTLPPQTCIYTTQGMLMCNAKGNEIPDMVSDIELNTHQPYYHQAIENMLMRPEKKQ